MKRHFRKTDFSLWLGLCLLATLVSACGFSLRGVQQPSLAIPAIRVQAADPYGWEQSRVRRRLIDAGYQVDEDAGFILRLDGESHSDETIGRDFRNEEKQYRIHTQLGWSLTGPGGAVVIAHNKLRTERTFETDEGQSFLRTQERRNIERENLEEVINMMIGHLNEVTQADVNRAIQRAHDIRALQKDRR
jgi:outer membrane lipopolysaccharide assembly protein LptE/RlpB